MKCPNCGFENEKDAQYCNKCGKNMQENSKIYCSKCGNELKAGSKFCNKCGAKVKSRKISKFMNLKYFWIALPIAAILLIMSTYPDIVNYFDPTSSLNMKNQFYIQSSFSGIKLIFLLLVNYSIILIFELQSKNFDFGKFLKRSFNFLTKISPLIILGSVLIFLNNISSGLFKYSFNIPAYISIITLIIIGILYIYHHLSAYAKNIKPKSEFWNKLNGIASAFFVVSAIFGGFSIIGSAFGRMSYSAQVDYNRREEITGTVKQLKKIFNDCQVNIDGEKAVDYTNCNLHFVNLDGSKINYQDLLSRADSDEANGEDVDLLFSVYMDNHDVYQYQDDVINEDTANDIIGSHKDFEKNQSLSLEFEMTPNGKVKIKVTPLDGVDGEFQLNNGPSLDGTLNLTAMDPTQASFTTAN
ncbi:zinc ribbon domain-containing protein [Ligilactobacillus aviarius]|uniref:zinc ribbon domain-containing protein n=1 Tax=Ligilactobacillus aviarius TaxID=1606 RepID=UPI0024B9C2AB|nr:zinc ribbon domain-containing protein [Ligilactobacillus aviarius]